MSKGWRRCLVGAIFCFLLIGFDLSRPPQDQWSAHAMLWGIDLYQATLSPLMPTAGIECRFTPTCSHYGEGAIRRYGALGGSWRAVWRILRCGPWTPRGTEDPP